MIDPELYLKTLSMHGPSGSLSPEESKLVLDTIIARMEKGAAEAERLKNGTPQT